MLLTYTLILEIYIGEEIILSYLNAIIKVKKEDIYLLQSTKVYHGVLVSTKRQALVCINHTAVIKRFYNIDTINLFIEINKM